MIEIAIETRVAANPGPPKARRQSVFYLTMALTIAALMVAGLSYDIPKYVLHPTVHRPFLLGIHSAVFVAWMVLYVLQSVLIYTRNVRWHRSLGWFGLALAIIMPPLGIATSLVMRRFNLSVFPSTDYPLDLAFLAAPLSEIWAFTVCAWIGIAMRKRPEYHRRLMFLSTASIAEAGFGRLPIPGMATWFFIGNLMFYAAAMVHDRMTIGHVHKVYRIAVPLLVLNEVWAMYLWLEHPAWWLTMSKWLIDIG
ncbi:MAG: hypothetical protein JWL66_1536 [Sphingomonadales bacterium]|nr:hypothetical protein [Sphingomonadales bacterium]